MHADLHADFFNRIGPFETSSDLRTSAAFRGKADVTRHLRTDANDPQRSCPMVAFF